jgi:hypothetical protein
VNLNNAARHQVPGRTMEILFSHAMPRVAVSAFRVGRGAWEAALVRPQYPTIYPIPPYKVDRRGIKSYIIRKSAFLRVRELIGVAPFTWQKNEGRCSQMHSHASLCTKCIYALIFYLMRWFDVTDSKAVRNLAIWVTMEYSWKKFTQSKEVFP